jgi:hypothetical protein
VQHFCLAPFQRPGANRTGASLGPFLELRRTYADRLSVLADVKNGAAGTCMVVCNLLKWANFEQIGYCPLRALRGR